VKKADAPLPEPGGSPEGGQASSPPGPDYYDQLLRLKAEFENFRKRTDRERPEWVRAGREDVLAGLLPIYDVLAAAHLQIQAHPSNEALAQGMELIFKEFNRLFETQGLAPIESVGRPYDHDLHEVLGTVERPDLEEGTVIEELQKGFTMGGRVLRPARVRVSKRPAPTQAPKEEQP